MQCCISGSRLSTDLFCSVLLQYTGFTCKEEMADYSALLYVHMNYLLDIVYKVCM